MTYLLVPLCAFLDRWGGGGFEFVSARFPNVLRRGFKTARRYGIPAVVLARAGWSWENLAIAIGMGAMLSLNIEEIEQRDWDEVAVKPLVIALLLHTMGFSWWALVIPAWWLLGTYLSNIGIGGWRLGWHWVELIRGAVIGAILIV